MGEIKSAFDQVVDRSHFQAPPPPRPQSDRKKDYAKSEQKDYDKHFNDVNYDDERKDVYKDIKVVGEEPPKRITVKFDQMTCPLKKDGPIQTDVQVSSFIVYLVGFCRIVDRKTSFIGDFPPEVTW